MHWTREVGISMRNFEVLDARIASALNKIIHNSQFKKRISLEEQKALKEVRFLRCRQIASLIYDYFHKLELTILSKTMPTFHNQSTKGFYLGIRL